MSDFIVYMIIFLLSAIPFFEASYMTPIAVLGGTNFFLTLIFGLLGNFLSLLAVVIFSEKVMKWFMKDKNKSRSQRAENIWKKLGFHGFIFLGPFLLSSHITIIAAVAFGATKTRAVVYVTLSMIGWSVLLSSLAYFGMDFLGLEDVQFLQQYLN